MARTVNPSATAADEPTRAAHAAGGQDQVVRNREQQTAVYGEPLGNLLGRVGEQLGLTQARIAGILGLSAPMLSQLASGHRVKIGNPVAVQRLQALVGLGSAVAAGRVPMAEVEPRLADIAAQAAVVTQSTSSAGLPAPAAAARAVQSLFRAVASAEELLGAAAVLDRKYPEIAKLLRVYGAGRTADAVAHLEANAHLL
jgi:transcriptional regulator with XRE-family HTH domain